MSILLRFPRTLRSFRPPPPFASTNLRRFTSGQYGDSARRPGGTRCCLPSFPDTTCGHVSKTVKLAPWARGFASGEVPSHQVISLPALSPTMVKGNIPSWNKKEGDEVAVGEILCSIETDKSTMEMEAMEEGFLAKILAPAGSNDVPVGQPIAIIVELAEDIAKVGDISTSLSNVATDRSSKKAEQAEKLPEEPKVHSDSLLSHPSRQRLGPAVRKLLAESGLDVTALRGTGPGGAVLKGDVLAAMRSAQKPSKAAEAKELKGPAQPPGMASPPASKASPEALPPLSSLAYDDLPTSQIRKVIARRLLESKSGVPHFYLSADVILDATLALRKELKDKFGAHLSVNDFIIKAAALALKAVPEANAHWDDKTGDIIPESSVDISIAVATEKGLMTPILRNADQKSLSVISSEVKVLAQKARDGKLSPQEFQGGTFSISNLGMFSVDHFCAIINPPQACILAVGRGEPAVIWEEGANDSAQGKPRAATKMTLTLSADHRVIDTNIGGRFLDSLAGIFREPGKILL